jgi:hypothetical protein
MECEPTKVNNNAHDKNDDDSDDDDDATSTTNVLDHHQLDKKTLPVQRLPHVYLDHDLKPCIVVAGEEHGPETGEHDDWHDIKAGGRSVHVPKKSHENKQNVSSIKNRTSDIDQTEQVKLY